MHATHTPEQWLPIPGYEGHYEVSDQGRVRSLTRTLPHPVSGTKTYVGRIKSTPRNKHTGYLMVQLARGGVKTQFTVHSLVLMAFVGPRPDGHVACHFNDIRTDNRAINLRWDTSVENHADMKRNRGHYNSNKDHCLNGHPFTPSNTWVSPTQGNRHCKKCRGERLRLHAQRARSA